MTTVATKQASAATTSIPSSTNQHPAVIAAGDALAPIRRRYDEAVRCAAKYHALLSPDRDTGVDVVARMEATLHRDSANLDVLRLEGELTTAQRALDVAR